MSENTLDKDIIFIEKWTEHLLPDNSTEAEKLAFVEEYWEEAHENFKQDIIDLYYNYQ